MTINKDTIATMRAKVAPHIREAARLMDTDTKTQETLDAVPVVCAHGALIVAHLTEALDVAQRVMDDADKAEPDPEVRVITWDKLEALYDRDWTSTLDDIADALKHAGAPPVWPADLQAEYNNEDCEEFVSDDERECDLWVYVRVLARHGVSVSGAPEWVTA